MTDREEILEQIIEKKAEIKELKKELKKINSKKEIKDKNQPPHLTVLEEIGNAITHGLGSVFAIIATMLMLVYSNEIIEIVSAVLYGTCMIILFTMSCLYHSFKYGSKVKRIFRRFDYSSIYLLIGGTFAPILILYLNNTLGIVILIIQWVIIAVGITMVGIFGPGRLKWLHFPAYFILGWLAGMFIIPLMIKNDLNFFWWILSGGLAYTLGMIPFCLGERKSAHFIWHFFVVAGAILQWIGVFVYLFLN